MFKEAGVTASIQGAPKITCYIQMKHKRVAPAYKKVIKMGQRILQIFKRIVNKFHHMLTGQLDKKNILKSHHYAFLLVSTFTQQGIKQQFSWHSCITVIT